ncbi:DUF1772 domain-containing protein [Congregibacter sp.]|uniref:anthrone oxygenase family protein n=1 Tax=Congregibacter sp. TaxID=2744308 RepID=UPI00385A909D
MNLLLSFVAILTLLGAAIMAGAFAAFSNFIMGALARLPDEWALSAMQSINVVVLNRWFLGVFAGTAVLSLILAGLALWNGTNFESILLMAAAIAYFGGCFLVTGLGNVPLNEAIANLDAASPRSASLWHDYLDRWTWLNSVRTFASSLCVLLIAISLLVQDHPK